MEPDHVGSQKRGPWRARRQGSGDSTFLMTDKVGWNEVCGSGHLGCICRSGGGVERSRAAGLHDPSVSHDGDTTGRGHGQLTIRCGDDEGHSRRALQGANLCQGPHGAWRIEPVEATGHQQDCRLDRKSPGERHELALRRIEILRADILQAVDTKPGQRVPDAGEGLCRGNILQAVGHVLRDGHVGKQRIVLRHEGKRAAVRRNACKIMVIEPDAASGLVAEAGDQPNETCLSRSGGPQQCHGFTGFDRKVNADDGGAGWIRSRQPLQLEGVDAGHVAIVFISPPKSRWLPEPAVRVFSPAMTDIASRKGSEGWVGSMKRGDRTSLARAITAVENDYPDAGDIVRTAHMEAGGALVLGVTGPPGSGKSTLTGALAREFRCRSKTVAVLAVDPSSPLTGGALLGDRIRMIGHSGDAGVFVRSLASRGRLGGLARSSSAVIDVMDAAGCDIVIVETVGVGQSETEIAGLADIRILVWPPGTGDDIQAAKAGILETADIIVVNKADLPNAPATQAALENAVSYRAGGAPSILMTIATRGTGVTELAECLTDPGRRFGVPAGRGAHLRLRHEILEAAHALVRERAEGHPQLAMLADDVASGGAGIDEAARRMLEAVFRERS